MIKLLHIIDEGISIVDHPEKGVTFMVHGVGGEIAKRTYIEGQHGKGEGDLTSDDKETIINNAKEIVRFYDSETECYAYWHGVSDMEGCFEACGTTFKHHQELYGQGS